MFLQIIILLDLPLSFKLYREVITAEDLGEGLGWWFGIFSFVNICFFFSWLTLNHFLKYMGIHIKCVYEVLRALI